LLSLSPGLNSLDVMKKKKHSIKFKEATRKVTEEMESAAANSDWNFSNKRYLLHAEQQALCQGHTKSISLYEASIENAKKSGFVHEEGLACELFGFYFKREKKNEKALEYFKQARECYEKWGSGIKEESMKKEIDSLNLISLRNTFTHA